MDAIDQLGLLHKALSGAEMPGHKYKSRKRVKGSWVYDYGDKKGKGAGGKSDPMDAVTHRDKHSVVTYFKDPYYAKLILAHVKSTPKYADTAAIKDYGRGYAVQYYPSGPYYPEREPGKMHDPFGVLADRTTPSVKAQWRTAFEAQVKRLLPGRQVTVTNRSITVTAGRNSQRYPLAEIFEGSEGMNVRGVAAAFKEMVAVDVPKPKAKAKPIGRI